MDVTRELETDPTDELQSEGEHERPTVPWGHLARPDAITLPAVGVAPCFDADAERFFAAGVPQAERGGLDDDELVAWWVAQRRRAFAPWVTAIVAVCVAVLAAGAFTV